MLSQVRPMRKTASSPSGPRSSRIFSRLAPSGSELIRRSALEEIGGLDERFFLYCEDIDLCRRLRAAGHGIRYEPAATVQHRGGHSAPRGSMLPIYAASRVLYARKHYRRTAVPLEIAGVAVGEATHALTSIRRPAATKSSAPASESPAWSPARPPG